MANIPGISGFIQPGAFARDRIISRGASIPGGLRVVAILGEGTREEVIVESAQGGGLDGSSACSPTSSGDGRYFQLKNYPVVSGRTELTLNGALLFGYEDTIDENSFDSKFDFRLDPETGCIELQGATIGDQGGKGYSASSLNVGNGILVQDDCGTLKTLDVLDNSTPAERWTVKCVSVVRDSNGDPVPGLATFSVVGSVSGQLYDTDGNPILFHSSYFKSTAGAVSGNEDACLDGFVVASGVDWGTAVAQPPTGDQTADTTSQIVISGNLISQGQALVGDFLCVDGYVGVEIESLSYSSVDNETTINLVTDSVAVGTYTAAHWDIKATNILIDNPSVAHNAITGVPTTAGNFKSSDVGKVVQICAGTGFDGGRYVITAVTSSRRVRVHALGDEATGFPSQQEVSGGLAATGLTFHLLEQNGVIVMGIKEGTVAFEVGDRFFVDVTSKALAKGDKLEATYIYESDLNDPEFFLSANDLFEKHGTPSEENTLSLGAQMVFENGAQGVFAVQCKPAIPRRTTVTLITEKNSRGVGGFSGCTSGCQYDDLMFTIPRPTLGLRNGRPDSNSRVNVFIVRGGKDIQVFPNKFDFYSSQLSTTTQLNNWIVNTDNAYSYTVVNTPSDVLGTGFAGSIDEDANGVYFLSSEFDFNGSNVGDQIMISSMEDAAQDPLTRTAFTTASEVGEELFGVGSTTYILTITSIATDNKVYVESSSVSPEPFSLGSSYEDIGFSVLGATSTSDDAALLLHRDLATSGTLKKGDGLKISYVDENDAAYFDTNWFAALEALEAVEAQIIVPLPTQAVSSIFRATVNHCENMSTIANRKERVALIGAQKGLTVAAATGTAQVAIEDIGILEGIQGDDAAEVLDGNVEDLANYKISDNYDSNRCVFFYPDAIVRNVSGTNVELPGYYMAAAAAGWLSSKQNVAIPLTFKTLSGFSLTRDKIFRQVTLNSLGEVGATVVQPVTGGGQVLAGRTTSQSGYVEDEEISIVFIRDTVKRTLRNSLKSYIGGVQSADTNNLISARVNTIMSSLVTQGLVTDYGNIRVEQDKVDPRQINVFLRFVPTYPINYVFIDIEVGVV